MRRLIPLAALLAGCSTIEPAKMGFYDLCAASRAYVYTGEARGAAWAELERRGLAEQCLQEQRAAAARSAAADAQYQAEQAALQRAMVNRSPMPVAPVQQQPLTKTAYWTGKSQPATSVTGLPGFNCEYNYAGKTFWRMYASCPSSVPVN